MTATAKPPPHPETGDGAAGAIDMAGGIERVMGDRSLFVRVLARFRNDYRRAAAAIRTALAAGDTITAQRLTHTLKGASGMIEAKSLQRQAVALEHALRGPSGDLHPQLDRLDSELDRVLRELDGLLEEGSALALTAPLRAEAHPAQAWPAPDALARLRELLDIGDGAAVDLVDEARAPLAAALGEPRLHEVAKAINEFDFELALKLLDPPGQRR